MDTWFDLTGQPGRRLPSECRSITLELGPFWSEWRPTKTAAATPGVESARSSHHTSSRRTTLSQLALRSRRLSQTHELTSTPHGEESCPVDPVQSGCSLIRPIIDHPDFSNAPGVREHAVSIPDLVMKSRPQLRKVGSWIM
jgi:hypothetical protein